MWSLLVKLPGAAMQFSPRSRDTGPALYPLEGTRRCGGVCLGLHVFCILAWFSLQIQVKIQHERRHLTASYGGQCFGSMERLGKKCLQVLFLGVCCGGVCCVFQLGFYHPREGIWEGKPTPSHWKGVALMLVHKRMGMINGRVLHREKTTSKGLKPRVWWQDQRHKQPKQRSKGWTLWGGSSCFWVTGIRNNRIFKAKDSEKWVFIKILHHPS